jgi:flagellar basal-body rod protein FlgF
MLRGLYTAAAGMLATTMATDVLASNLANVNTVGFKGDKLNFQTFQEMMLQRVTMDGQQNVGSIMTGSQVYQTFVNQAPGTLRSTGNTFDVALEGDGYFTVKAPGSNEMLYTRAGNFTVDSQGFITTINGARVQGKLGDIQVNLDDSPFKFSSSGELSAKGRVIDQLDITRFTNNQSLLKVSDNTYQTTPASRKIPPAGNFGALGYSVRQGALEESNVNPVAELVSNIQGMRLYEALQKNIHLSNETLEKAVNEVGRVK